MVDDLVERVERAVVHVGRSERDVAQARGAERTLVLGTPRHFETAQIGGVVHADAAQRLRRDLGRQAGHEGHVDGVLALGLAARLHADVVERVIGEQRVVGGHRVAAHAAVLAKQREAALLERAQCIGLAAEVPAVEA